MDRAEYGNAVTEAIELLDIWNGRSMIRVRWLNDCRQVLWTWRRLQEMTAVVWARGKK